MPLLYKAIPLLGPGADPVGLVLKLGVELPAQVIGSLAHNKTAIIVFVEASPPK
jgi:hypothetical protein